LERIVRATASDESFLKYSEDEPRVPAGSREGGQWTNGGGGGDVNSIDDPPIIPVYPIESILAGLSGGSAISAVRCLLGGIAEDEASQAVKDAAQAIEDYFGGQPDRTFTNPAGDLIMMGGDKKIRFDINNPGDDLPHFHIEEKPQEGGKWPDSGSEHRYYFQNEE
jgi:hypothetical protein